MSLDAHVRQQLIDSLRTGNAHLSFEQAVASFPVEKINHFPANVPYSYWHLIEHVRITQRDILDYMIDGAYSEPHWPDDYWPSREATTDQSGWEATIAAFLDDRERLIAIIENPETHLAAPLPANPEHTVLREMLVVIDHNAYHIGEFAILRQTDDTWGDAPH